LNCLSLWAIDEEQAGLWRLVNAAAISRNLFGFL
jgi:hypothetical protein